jgi:histidine triad (HIT) family protein
MIDCVFDKIITGQIPSSVVYQDDTVFAFKDINPKAPVHILIIPKKHIASISDINLEDLPLMGHLLESAKIIASQLGLKSYKLVINNGTDAGQVVMHLHMHMLSGKKIESPV